MARVRRSPRALALLLNLAAACAAAGCTTVSAPRVPAPVPGPSVTRHAGPVRPDDIAVRPGPAHEVLETVGPRPVTEPPGTPSAAPRPRVRAAPPPRPQRGAPRPIADRSTPRRRTEPMRPAVPLPGDSSVCELGETYGGWEAGSKAAAICRQAYGR